MLRRVTNQVGITEDRFSVLTNGGGIGLFGGGLVLKWLDELE